MFTSNWGSSGCCSAEQRRCPKEAWINFHGGQMDNARGASRLGCLAQEPIVGTDAFVRPAKAKPSDAEIRTRFVLLLFKSTDHARNACAWPLTIPSSQKRLPKADAFAAIEIEVLRCL